jgi:uncharacterized protein (DUF433 family)
MTGKQIYFLRPVGQLGPIKIGCSKEPEGRLAMLAIMSPVRLEIVATVPGTHAEERKLHGMFASQWLHHEWFAASKELLALLDYVQAKGALPELPEGKIVRLPRRKPQPGVRRTFGPSPKTIALGERCRADYESGMTLRQVAEKHGSTFLTVRKGLIAAGVSMRRYTTTREKGVEDEARAAEFERRYAAGETLQQIGEAFGVSRERVRQVLRKVGVPSLGWRKENLRQPHPLSEAEIEAARLYDEGTRPKDLVQRFGLTHAQLLAAVSRCGYPHKSTAEWARLSGVDEIAARVAALYQAGTSAAEIARTVPGIRLPERVYWYLRRAGVKARRRVYNGPHHWVCTRQAGDETRRKVIALHAAGKRPREIAAELGRAEKTVRGILSAQGILLRRAA